MRKVTVDWSRKRDKTDLKPALSRFNRYLENLGLKKNTIILYIKLINTYLSEVNSESPSVDDPKKFYDSLHDKGLSRSAMNNFSAAIIKYHAMIDRPVKLPFLKLNNSLPYYFDGTDIIKIFSACDNLKHYCVLKVLFFGCIRSGELCNLDVPDYDSANLTPGLRPREAIHGHRIQGSPKDAFCQPPEI
jgi:integrase/recombinase XerD